MMYMDGLIGTGTGRTYEDFQRQIPELIKPLFDKLIKVSKLPLFNSYCLFRSSKLHRFNT